ncbi:MAG TPA: asparagine--tRNA ligase [Candidatus Bathyarchaeota archaeon]|nr:asparagine--tRNA ligase [Candidatus Bathyarchaeota archaeon]
MTGFVKAADILHGKYDDGAEVNLRGWIYTSRSSGGIQFLEVRDGSGVIQCTLNKRTIDEETFNNVEKYPLETALELKGKVKKDDRAPGGWELRVTGVGAVYESKPDYPIVKKEQGVEFLMDNRHLYIREPKLQNIFQLRAKFLMAARDWFKEHEYTEVQTPMFMTASVEGGSTLFSVDYFEREGVYLSQSWQLYAEALISSLGKIYTIAPSFRAEPSRTRRHLSEFLHMELEEPWSTLSDIQDTGDKLVSHIANTLASEMPEKVKEAGRDPEYLAGLKAPFPKISYDEAVEIVQSKGVEMFWGDDFGWQQEGPLTEEFETPFWVVGFPSGIKPFYHMPDPDRPEVTLSSDLLAPEGYGEIIGGGQRVHNYEQLYQRTIDDGLDPANYEWYMDLRKWGTVPHSGFGLGVERVLMWMLKLDHIRDTVPFPRDMRRVYP